LLGRSVCYASPKLDEAALQSYTRALLTRLAAGDGPAGVGAGLAEQAAALGRDLLLQVSVEPASLLLFLES
jgi:hypothetical protein